MEAGLSTLANVAQLLGIRDMKTLFLVLVGVALIQVWQRLYSWMDWKGPHLGTGLDLLLWCVILLVVSASWIYFLTRPAKPENLIRNPGFVEDTRHWGTGYVELLLANGNFPHEATRHAPLILSGGAMASGRRDTEVVRSEGYASFLIDHKSAIADHRWSSLSQLVTGLKPRTDYVASFWIRAENLDEKALFLTLDYRWAKPHCYAPPGTYDWREVKCPPRNTGDRDFLDFRFVMQAPGRVWIDAASLFERAKP